MAEATPFRVDLFGYPLGHTVSPWMHHAAARVLNLRLEYSPRQVTIEQLRPAVERLRGHEYLGANVTLPHKVAMLSMVDAATPLATRIGAVNTVFKHEGRLLGDNTDAPALLRCLSESLSFSPRDERVVLLGAGGAARAAAIALLDSGVAQLTIWNRDSDRAVALCHALSITVPGPHRRISPVTAGHLDDSIGRASLVINATSVGLDNVSSPIIADCLAPVARVFDMVYGPDLTPLVRAARASGRQAFDGLWMLVYQASSAFTLWTSVIPPEQVMFDAAWKALDARRSAATPPTGSGNAPL